jgi:tetratricopeptide (TPR) repeat protein
MPKHIHQKNIIHGIITAGGNVHIGDIIYNIERDFKSGSILFLRLDKKDETRYEAHLSVKSKHSDKGTLATSGEKWCEQIDVTIPPQLFDKVAEFQTFRRSRDAQTRYKDILHPDNHNIQAIENKLAQQIFQTFFAGEIGKVCGDFIRWLEEQRIEELLLAISADDAPIVNLPFEMVLPLLFPPKLNEAKKSLALSNFGLVRTTIPSLDAFDMHGNHATAAPLKMLFITALPENLDERGKMLQIEEEQTRLIERIGDTKPQIVIEFLDNASLAELNKALHARQHDIVHISGHGAYQAAENKGVLYFENQDGDEEQVSGKALGETLRQHACVKLLLLSACETAMAGSEGGVTEQVAAFGVPSIVAMRFAVTDEGAKVFTTELYTQLAKGLSLTRALGYARAALHEDITQRREHAPQIAHIAEWFTPVVYHNQSVGALIDETQPYHLPDNFYPLSSFLKTKQSRLIGEGFIGRKRYLIQMRQAFQEGQHVCLHGLGGLGKTTLAEAFAHNYDNHSHATIIFRNGNQINEAHILNILNKRFAKTHPDLAEQLQQAIDDPKTDVLDKLQLLIDNYLKGRKTILLFDNVEDVQTDAGGAYQRSIGSDSLSAFLRHLCANTPTNCHILLTTRYKIENLAGVVEHLALDKMGYAEQYRLLNYSPILRGIPLQDRDDVYKRLDGHPRGYEYLAALLKHDPTFSWQQVSKAEADVFENLLLAKVYERLTEREKAVFQMVSVFIARTPLAALAAVSGENEADLLPVLQSLQDWSLCFLEKDGRFEVHRLTREWMKENVVSSETTKKWALKAGEYYLDEQNLKSYKILKDIIISAKYFEISHEWEKLVQVTFSLHKHYDLIGHYQKAIEVNVNILEKNLSDRYNAISLNNLSSIYIRLGNYDIAIDTIKKGLKYNNLTNDENCKAALINNFALIYMNRNEYYRALKYFEKCLIIQKSIKDFQGLSTSLSNMGQLYYFLNKDDKSYLCYKECLEIQEKNNFTQGISITLNNFGQLFAVQGKHSKAKDYFEKSLSISQKLNFKEGISSVYSNLGILYQKTGSLEQAIFHFEKSLEFDSELCNKHGISINLKHLGEVMLAQGNLVQAMKFSQQCLKQCREMAVTETQCQILETISQIYLEQGDYEMAILTLKESLTVIKIHDRATHVEVTLNKLIEIASQHNLNGEILEYSFELLDFLDFNIENMRPIGIVCSNIGGILTKKEMYIEAIPYLLQAYHFFKNLDAVEIRIPNSYLNFIVNKIGGEKFEEVTSQIEFSSEGIQKKSALAKPNFK